MNLQYNLGEFSKGRHYFPVRVFYNHTDADGVVYFANYLRISEEARHAMLEVMFRGTAHEDGDRTVDYMIRKAEVDYFKSAKFGDDLVVESWFGKVGNSSLEMLSRVTRDGETLNEVRVVVVFVEIATKKPTRIPDYWRECIEKCDHS